MGWDLCLLWVGDPMIMKDVSPTKNSLRILLMPSLRPNSMKWATLTSSSISVGKYEQNNHRQEEMKALQGSYKTRKNIQMESKH